MLPDPYNKGTDFERYQSIIGVNPIWETLSGSHGGARHQGPEEVIVGSGTWVSLEQRKCS